MNEHHDVALPSPLAAQQRRTFAIISHPDAGKTTLTEKLLLHGGAIHLAGEVRAKGERRRTRSDWMRIERRRGISVTTSVMTFLRGDIVFNLLDTPGHEDFSEDAYRTLTAVDSAVMVIDAARGIEPRTRKLFEVCRLRDMPIITFVNKMDREARDPFQLIDQITDELALDVTPLNWPVGAGRDFRGCYDPAADRLLLPDAAQPSGERVLLMDGAGDTAAQQLSAEAMAQLREGAALVREALPPFDQDAYLAGNQTPLLFGSALRNFGVAGLLDTLAAHAPPPRPRQAEQRLVAPQEDKVSGFIFKVQANMDPNHRDRIAFLRLCSGRFRRGMKLTHGRSGKVMALHNPILFFARERELAEEALPGDIIGLPNHGVLSVGDTLSEGEDLRFTGIPDFAPEILRRVRLADPLKGKHLSRALESLAEEGVAQIFRPDLKAAWIVGGIGQLQLDVLVERVQEEYGLAIALEAAPYETARWINAADDNTLAAFMAENRAAMARDRDDHPVFLVRNSWELDHQSRRHAGVRFSRLRERA